MKVGDVVLIAVRVRDVLADGSAIVVTPEDSHELVKAPDMIALGPSDGVLWRVPANNPPVPDDHPEREYVRADGMAVTESGRADWSPIIGAPGPSRRVLHALAAAISGIASRVGP